MTQTTQLCRQSLAICDKSLRRIELLGETCHEINNPNSNNYTFLGSKIIELSIYSVFNRILSISITLGNIGGPTISPNVYGRPGEYIAE